MQKQVINIITNEISRARSINPSYSLRAFSKRVGVHPSALSEILNGKRRVTKKMGERILLALGMNRIEIESIFNEESRREVSELSLDYFKTISEWYYYAILSLAEIPDFKAEPEWISKRLNISPKTAKMAIERLIRLEMLVENEDGNYIASGVQYKTPTDIINTSLKNHTVQTLDLAKESLFIDPVDKRDFSTITMAIDPSKIEVAKKMISNFRKKLSQKLEAENKTEVYKLAIQLFPLSRGTEESQ